MDPILTPAVILLAKSIIDTIRKDRSFGSLYVGKYTSLPRNSSDNIVNVTQQVITSTLASSTILRGQCTPHEQNGSAEKPEVKTNPIKKTSKKSTSNRAGKRKPQEVEMKLIEDVVVRIKEEIPGIIKEMHNASPTVIPDSLDSIYISQITAAQEFINNNSKADLSQIKCILRNMLPKEYHDKIEELREYQDPKIININGGQNLVAPNAKKAQQDIQKRV